MKAGIAGAALVGSGFSPFAPAQASEWKSAPEKGAKLRVLRWKRFVQGDEDAWLANTKKFSEQFKIDVRVDSENWEDVRPKAAVAANVGSGPDIIIGTHDDPHQYPDKLVDLTDLATYFDEKYKWYDVCKRYGMRDKKWIGLPMGAAGNAITYRMSHVKAAGFDGIPKDTAGFLKLCQALKEKGLPPAGFTQGHGVGDGNNYAHWLLWSHGGKMVDENNKVTINSPETIDAIKYSVELYKTFIPGTESWLDVNNNRAFLAGQVSVIANGVSAYYAAKNDPKMAEMAADIGTTNLPVGKSGKDIELHQVTSMVLFKYSKYPNAAKAYLQFMFEKPQMDEWIKGSSAYCCQTLKAYADNPIWTADPAFAPYAKASETLRTNGYAGKLGPASAAVMADYVLVDMFAEACTGQHSPEDAAARAEKRAKRYYEA
jgi:multiple sugar transport system substrate-binding protein